VRTAIESLLKLGYKIEMTPPLAQQPLLVTSTAAQMTTNTDHHAANFVTVSAPIQV
jgi:hypothetical protein